MTPSPDRLSKSPKSAPPNSAAPDELPTGVPESASENHLSSPESAPEIASPDGSSEANSLVPKRPLMRPVNRPQPPTTPPLSPAKPVAVESMPSIEPVQADSAPVDEPAEEDEDGKISSRMQPIPPPSEPKQYRAIGLVRGRYIPSEEQFTRGQMITADGANLEAVLLGRVMSLVRNHLDLEQDHLWVVYPRTREAEESLHVQIVGVWEPEKLNQKADSEEDNAPEVEPVVSDDSSMSPGYEDDYFSVRGEVVFCAQEEKQVVVKIQQAARKTADKPKAFKLKLEGDLASPKTLGYFWNLDVKRVGISLVITSGTPIGLVPPKKKPATKFKKERRPFKKGAPPTGNRSSGAAAPPRRDPIPKPVKRNEKGTEG